MKRPPAEFRTPACPVASCHAHMERRSGKNGAFWGCSRFPHCRGARAIDLERDNELLPLKPSTVWIN